MANTGFLRDWKWFYQNGGKLSRYSNVDKTSRFNLTVKEAVDNYKIDMSLVSGLPDNEMIAHDSIRFENVLGGVGNNGYINTVESIDENLVIIGGKFDEFNNESCSSCIFLQPRLDTDFNFSQSIFPRHVNVYKNGGIGEIRKIRAKYISAVNPQWYVVFCGDYDTFQLDGVSHPSSGFDIIRITKDTNTGVKSYTHMGWTNVFNGRVLDFDFSREFEVDKREIYIVGNFTTHNGTYTPGIIKYDYRDGIVKDYFTNSQFSAPTFQGTKTVVRSIKKEIDSGGIVIDRYSIAVGGLFSYKNALNETCNNFIITNNSGNFNNSIYLHSGKALHNFDYGEITDITHIYQANGDVDYGISGVFSSYNGYSSYGFVVLRYSPSSTGSRTIFDIVYPKSNVDVHGTVKGILTPIGDTRDTSSLYFYGNFTDMRLITKSSPVSPELTNPHLSGLNGICRYERNNWTTYTSGGIGINTSSTGLKQGFWGGVVNDMVRIKNISQPGYVYEVYMVVGSFRENINGTKSFGIAILVMEQITPASGIKPGPSFSIYPNSEYYFNPDNK